MEKTVNQSKGSLKVSENVIVTIAKNAALEIEGVQKIATKPLSIKSFLQSSSDPADIRVSMLDGVCMIGMSIVVKTGINVVSVCEQIQEKVKAAVQSMTGVTVSKVDVSVADVAFDAVSED